MKNYLLSVFLLAGVMLSACDNTLEDRFQVDTEAVPRVSSITIFNNEKRSEGTIDLSYPSWASWSWNYEYKFTVSGKGVLNFKFRTGYDQVVYAGGSQGYISEIRNTAQLVNQTTGNIVSSMNASSTDVWYTISIPAAGNYNLRFPSTIHLYSYGGDLECFVVATMNLDAVMVYDN